jgi:hypothetical protein
LEFRKRITTSYDGLFRENDEQEAESDFSETTQFGKRWGWYSSIYALAKGDVTRFNEVTRQPLTKCLTLLTFEKEKQEIEQRKIDRIMKR